MGKRASNLLIPKTVHRIWFGTKKMPAEYVAYGAGVCALLLAMMELAAGMTVSDLKAAQKATQVESQDTSGELALAA